MQQDGANIIALISCIYIHDVRVIQLGVNYGQIGDNLPSAGNVIGLYRKCMIKRIRLFEPIAEILEALKG